MNEQPNSVPASPAPDIPPLTPDTPAPAAPVAAPVDLVSANPAPAAPGNVSPAPVAVEPDYRAMYENLRRENEILRQNAETAQRSPVQGVAGGGVTVPNDDFLRGFDSDTW
ncbi:MAG: hypothetical protein IJQ81_08410 [Oscillibacter sp.]|nr:hypothetical protein [Oscillibacter sp.]